MLLFYSVYPGKCSTVQSSEVPLLIAYTGNNNTGKESVPIFVHVKADSACLDRCFSPLASYLFFY